jgi:hypothetical protein
VSVSGFGKGGHSIERVNEFLTRAGGLVKIEDILPLFPDFVQIDNFKDAICASLEDYNNQIEALKGEMEDATAIADALRCVRQWAAQSVLSASVSGQMRRRIRSAPRRVCCA